MLEGFWFPRTTLLAFNRVSFTSRVTVPFSSPPTFIIHLFGECLVACSTLFHVGSSRFVSSLFYWIGTWFLGIWPCLVGASKMFIYCSCNMNVGVFCSESKVWCWCSLPASSLVWLEPLIRIIYQEKVMFVLPDHNRFLHLSIWSFPQLVSPTIWKFESLSIKFIYSKCTNQSGL